MIAHVFLSHGVLAHEVFEVWGSWCACETVPTLVYLKCPTLGSLFRHSPRAICTVLLDPRDPLLQSERTRGFAADPDYWKGEVFAYVGLPQNLKDLNFTGRVVDLTFIILCKGLDVFFQVADLWCVDGGGQGTVIV
jgi:hypothetical protein